MSQSQSRKPQNSLNLLVFKDNLKARSFAVPMRWFTEIGLFLSLLVGVSILAIFFAVKYYIAYSKTDVTLVHQLEKTIESLHTQMNELKASKATSTPSKPLTSLDQETQTVATGLFYSFPSDITAPPKQGLVPIEIQKPKVEWKGSTLVVNYDITFIGSQTSSQQGRIVILARGPGILRAHPDTALSSIQENTLINPDLGEYFSVSRFRRGQVQFNIPKENTITGVQIFVFGRTKNLLISQGLAVPERNE